MLYKFTSKAAADVIMLPPHARRLLVVLGKREPEQAGDTPGIVLADQMAGALERLNAAIAAEEAALQAARDAAQALGEPPPPTPSVMLRQRAHPLIAMLQRSAREGHDVVWSVSA